jgi:hypothetical protein
MPNPPGSDRNDASNAAGLEPDAVSDGGAEQVASESDPVDEQTAAP